MRTGGLGTGLEPGGISVASRNGPCDWSMPLLHASHFDGKHGPSLRARLLIRTTRVKSHVHVCMSIRAVFRRLL